MQLKGIEVENFRAIQGATLSDLPPVVGIWGRNGTGKSALVQSIVALKSLARNGYGATPPPGLNSEGLLLGDWGAVYFKGEDPSKRLRIALEFDTSAANAVFERTTATVNLSVPDPRVLDGIRYFPPRRTLTARSQTLNEYSSDGLALAPNRIHAYLHWLLHTKLYERQTTGVANELNDLDRWMSKFGLGTLGDRANPGPVVEVSGMFEDRETHHKTVISDAGFGGNSMLPILLEAFSFKDGILLIEEPEISLHPGAQADLFDLFIELAQKRGHQIIFTSHSEYLIRRFARYHREAAAPVAVGVIVATKDETGAHFRPEPLDDLYVRWENRESDLLTTLHERF